MVEVVSVLLRHSSFERHVTLSDLEEFQEIPGLLSIFSADLHKLETLLVAGVWVGYEYVSIFQRRRTPNSDEDTS
jgi:hypothetical protein